MFMQEADVGLKIPLDHGLYRRSVSTNHSFIMDKFYRLTHQHDHLTNKRATAKHGILLASVVLSSGFPASCSKCCCCADAVSTFLPFKRTGILSQHQPANEPLYHPRYAPRCDLRYHFHRRHRVYARTSARRRRTAAR